MRTRIKRYKLESSSNLDNHRKAKTNNVIIYANTFNKFNPKVIRVF